MSAAPSDPRAARPALRKMRPLAAVIFMISWLQVPLYMGLIV
ncbi:TIGR00645 family protein, partial [Burkholderia pseudomallei]